MRRHRSHTACSRLPGSRCSIGVLIGTALSHNVGGRPGGRGDTALYSALSLSYDRTLSARRPAFSVHRWPCQGRPALFSGSFDPCRELEGCQAPQGYPLEALHVHVLQAIAGQSHRSSSSWLVEFCVVSASSYWCRRRWHMAQRSTHLEISSRILARDLERGSETGKSFEEGSTWW